MSKQLMRDAFSTMHKEIQQAQHLTQQGEFIKAETIYLEMLNQEPNCPPALYGLADLADKINDQEVRADLLKRAIEQIISTEDRIQKGVLAIWLAEQAEALIMLGRQNEAKACISESERVIKENLA